MAGDVPGVLFAGLLATEFNDTLSRTVLKVFRQNVARGGAIQFLIQIIPKGGVARR